MLLPDPEANTDQTPFLFPLDVVYWSLLFEILANAVYASAAKRLSMPILAVVVAASAVGLLGWALSSGSVAGGDSTSNVVGGLARVAFGFSTGVLIYRLHQRRAFASLNGSTPLAPPIAFMAAVWMKQTLVVEILLALLGLPMLLVLSVEARSSARCAPMLRTLGELSYPLYAIHLPLIWVAGALVRSRGLDGRVMLLTPPVSIAAALAIHRFIDLPVRRFLTARLAPPQTRRAIAN
jgi:peptidoglycan/LPS O-acetylase OafA/YrhL